MAEFSEGAADQRLSYAETPQGAGDLGIDPPAAVVSWPEVMAPPVKEITNEMIEGDSPEDIAGKLADKIMEEKVL